MPGCTRELIIGGADLSIRGPIALTAASLAGGEKLDTTEWGTALEYAEQQGHAEVAALLRDPAAVLREKAAQDAVDAFVFACGRTPGKQGTQNDGKLAEVELYLKNGGDVNAKHRVGWPALTFATMSGQIKTVKLLLDKGAALDATRSMDRTALHDAATNGFPEICALLLDKGADVMARDDQGFTPLHVVGIFCGQPAMAALLLDRGADVDARTVNGATPLHLAAQEGYDAIVHLLLARGADVNAIDGNGGATPLFLAAHRGRTSCVRELILGGADPSIKTHWGTALELAEQEGHTEVVALLRSQQPLGAGHMP